MSKRKRWNIYQCVGKGRQGGIIANCADDGDEAQNLFHTPSEGSMLYDFSRDAEVIKARNEVIGSRLKYPEYQMETCISNRKESNVKNTSKNRKKIEVPAEELGFRTASGRPVINNVLSVLEKGYSKEMNQKAVGGSSLGFARKCKVTSFQPPRQINNDVCQNESPVDQNQPLLDTKQCSWKDHASLKRFDANIIELIEAEIMSKHVETGWGDVAGFENVKKILKEVIILPFLRPDLFTGIRSPPKGILLFGPPGTGKTLIGRCVASQCNATFFNISASSITSKWVGEGEKLVRGLFAVARILQPSIIFIDEIDSLLTSRKETEHESSRRIKTEFLVNLDGVDTLAEERIFVLGATNRPQELDDAAKRRFAKRLFIGLPCKEARSKIIYSLYKGQKHTLVDEDIEKITQLTEGYSGADMKQLCCEAALGPIRDIVDSSTLDIATIKTDEVRPISLNDFENALMIVRPTVVEKDLIAYEEWNQRYGST